jgi:hypothetical protein
MSNRGHISKKSRHSKWQLLLMAIPILIITGFQVFWLQENYIKEKKNLEFRSNVVFKETVRKLQAKKLNLDRMINDSNGNVNIELMGGEQLDLADIRKNLPTYSIMLRSGLVIHCGMEEWKWKEDPVL